MQLPDRRFENYQTWYDRTRLAKPFLRWAGGKQPFLLKHPSIVPAFTGKYLEPFLGGGSVFFHIMRTQHRPCPAILGDINRELIRAYAAIREDPDVVSSALESFQAGYSAASDKAEYYNSMRQLYNAQRPRVDPALFIFINRTCWNGLYRTNRAGQFNVPYGNPKAERVVPSLQELISVSAALLQAELRATSWENTLAMADPGDFVFLDPPYYSDTATSDAKYDKRPFTKRDHYQLAQAIASLASRGIAFVMTNSGEEEVKQLYESYGLLVRRINVPRFISSKLTDRTPAAELLITPKS